MRHGVEVLLLLAFAWSAAATDPQKIATAATAAGSPNQKRPWEWTIEERLAARLDPALIAERQRQEEARYRAVGAEPRAAARQDAYNYSVDGYHNPELLLPHEVFDSLMSGFIPDDERRQRKRESLRTDIAASDFDPEPFWAQLRSVAGEYIDTYRYPSQNAVGHANEPDPSARCRAAFIALNNARNLFGQERFDRFLYEFVAPTMVIASSTNATDPAARLRYVGRGCQ